MKRIDSGYKLIEVISSRRGSADTVVNVATVKFGFGAVVLIEKLAFNVAYEKSLTLVQRNIWSALHALQIFRDFNFLGEHKHIFSFLDFVVFVVTTLIFY